MMVMTVSDMHMERGGVIGWSMDHSGRQGEGQGMVCMITADGGFTADWVSLLLGSWVYAFTGFMITGTGRN